MDKQNSAFNIVRFIYDFEDQLEELSIQYKNELWNWYCGKESHSLKDLETRMLKVMSNTDLLKRIEESEEKADEFQKRKLFLLKTEIQRTLIEQDTAVLRKMVNIQEAWNQFTAKTGGEELSLIEMNRELGSEPDGGKRLEIYQSLCRFSRTLEPAWMELIAARNRIVKNFGFRDFTDYKMTITEVAPEFMTTALEFPGNFPEQEISWSRELLDHAQDQVLSPWDFPYLYRQYHSRMEPYQFPVERVQHAVWNYLETLGFRMQESGLATIDAGDDFPSMVIPVRIPTDIRMFTCSDPGWDSFYSLIREYGRALHYSLINQNGYILKGVNPVLSDAVAELFADMILRPAALNAIGIADAESVMDFHRNVQAIQLRMMMTLCEFEMFLYTGDTDSAEDRWLELTRKHLGYADPRFSDWCLQQVLLTRPFSAMEWVLAYYLKERLHKTLQKHESGRWAEILQMQVFEWGNFLPWYEIDKRFSRI